jgi:hypothetical protein
MLRRDEGWQHFDASFAAAGIAILFDTKLYFAASIHHQLSMNLERLKAAVVREVLLIDTELNQAAARNQDVD